MFDDILKRRYETLLRERSKVITNLKKLILQQEVILANKEVEILDLKDQLKAQKKAPAKKIRQKRTTVKSKKIEVSTDDTGKNTD